MTPHVPIHEAIADRKLLGAALGDLETWRTWIACLKASEGIRLDPDELSRFQQVAGGRNPPKRRVREFIGGISRRSGKGRMAGARIVHAALLSDHSYLAPGETGFVPCVSPTREQANIIKNYARGFIEASPILCGELVDETHDRLRLRNGIQIVTLAADYRSLRGLTLAGLAVLDEAAFLRDAQSATPDVEAVRALMPGLSTSGGMLWVVSSLYRQAGFLYERHRDYFGRDDDNILVVSGPSTAFNPVVDQAAIAAAQQIDPESARSEWMGEFRSDLSSFLDDETVRAAVGRRPLELPPRPGIQYAAFYDSSGGRSDAAVLGIGHTEGDQYIVDLVRGWPSPHNPLNVIGQAAEIALRYGHGCQTVHGDNFSAEFVVSAFRTFGIKYERADLTASQAYLEALPAFATGQVNLPNHAALLTELRQLERRTSRMGKDVCSHPVGGHDDYAATCCGLIRLLAAPKRNSVMVGFGAGFGPIVWRTNQPVQRAWRRGPAINPVDAPLKH
jgi:hypothetical protein